MDETLEQVADRYNLDDPYTPRADFGVVGDEAGTAGGRICWNVKHVQFESGGGEVVAYRSTILKLSGPRLGVDRAKRGESENRAASVEASVRRARKAIRHRCSSIDADRLLTLTYRENMQDEGRLRADFDAFRRRMSKAGQWHYVATVEKQERGAFHIHVAVHGRLSYNLVRSIWRGIVGQVDGKSGGNIDVRNPSRWQFRKNRLASYIAKYVGKDADGSELNKKRYWSSKGIPAPVVDFFGMANDAGAVIRTAYSLIGNKCGMLAHFDHAMGVLWMSYEAGAGAVDAVGAA